MEKLERCLCCCQAVGGHLTCQKICQMIDLFLKQSKCEIYMCLASLLLGTIGNEVYQYFYCFHEAFKVDGSSRVLIVKHHPTSSILYDTMVGAMVGAKKLKKPKVHITRSLDYLHSGGKVIVPELAGTCFHVLTSRCPSQCLIGSAAIFVMVA